MPFGEAPFGPVAMMMNGGALREPLHALAAASALAVAAMALSRWRAEPEVNEPSVSPSPLPSPCVIVESLPEPTSAPNAVVPESSHYAAAVDSFDDQVRVERQIILAAADAIRLIQETKVCQGLPHFHAVERQFILVERHLREVADFLGGTFFWRYGRDQPMAELFQLPLIELAASRDSLVPVTNGYIKDHWRHGDYAVARYLVSGTDPSMSRYREYSSGVLDALQRDRLLRVLNRMFWPVWDIPLTWGDEDDCIGFGMDNAHSVSAFGVAMRTQWESYAQDERPGLQS